MMGTEYIFKTSNYDSVQSEVLCFVCLVFMYFELIVEYIVTICHASTSNKVHVSVRI